jgi:hypothetical protein
MTWRIGIFTDFGGGAVPACFTAIDLNDAGRLML